MPKVVSQKQRTANRQNAAKSTGPKTARGKARASRNALKHGLLAQTVVVTTALADEHREQFDALLADFVAQLKPEGILEEALVERIATCYWRLARVQRFENDVIAHGAESAATPPGDLDKLRNNLEAADCDLQTERHLTELLETPSENRTPADTNVLQHSLADFAKTYGLTRLNLEPQALQKRIRDMLPDIIFRLERRVERLRADLHSAEHEDVLRARRESLAASLPQGNELFKILRYETMLDRQIHRALAEFRKLRALRRTPTSKKKRLRNIRKGAK